MKSYILKKFFTLSDGNISFKKNDKKLLNINKHLKKKNYIKKKYKLETQLKLKNSFIIVSIKKKYF